MNLLYDFRVGGFATTIDGDDQFLTLIFLQLVSHSDLEKSHNLLGIFLGNLIEIKKWVRSCF